MNPVICNVDMLCTIGDLVRSFNHTDAGGIIDMESDVDRRWETNFCKQLSKPENFTASMCGSIIFCFTCGKCSSSLTKRNNHCQASWHILRWSDHGLRNWHDWHH